MVLNEDIARVLFRHLPRLQPPRIYDAARNSGQLTSPSSTSSSSSSTPLPSPGTSSSRRRQQVQQPLQQPGSNAIHLAAVSRGFNSAAHERQEFELMVFAVLTVLQPQLATFSTTALLEAAECLRKLQFGHDAFVQVSIAIFERRFCPHM